MGVPQVLNLVLNALGMIVRCRGRNYLEALLNLVVRGQARQANLIRLGLVLYGTKFISTIANLVGS